MNSTSRMWIILGGLSGLIGVAAGAFGAHALKTRMDAEHLAIFETGVRYQMYHAPALLLVGWLARRRPGTAATLAGGCMAIGTLIFSGSLYALALTGQRYWGAVTPFGGLAFLLGWLCIMRIGWAETQVEREPGA